MREKLGYPNIFFNKRKFTFLISVEKWDCQIGDEEYNEYRIYFLSWELNLIFKK
jgi:hypothetical protein